MQDSNLRMPESKSGALPTWLIPNKKLVCLKGVEPLTPALEGRCSIQLSYRHICKMERVKGIEPSQSAWKAGALPLSYTRMLVEGAGFEPAKALPTDLQSAPFSHSGIPPYKNGDPEGARTLDLQRDRLAF